jgi:hypothetical protein
MKLTIIKDDNVVGVNGVFREVDLSELESGIRAVQWDGSAGHIEFEYGTNEDISDIDEFQPFIDLWTSAAPPPAPEPTAAERIAAAHARINSNYQDAVNALTAGYPDTEIASWPKQETEARAYIEDSAAAAPWLRSAAASRGITVDELAGLVVANADALAPLHGALTGKRQKLRDMIDGLGDNPAQSTLDTVQW